MKLCAAEARGANASTLDPTTQAAALDADLRQTRVLLEQAAVAIGKAVMDGDLGPGDAGTLNGLLEKSLPELNPGDLGRAVANMAAACALFPEGDMKDRPAAR